MGGIINRARHFKRIHRSVKETWCWSQYTNPFPPPTPCLLLRPSDTSPFLSPSTYLLLSAHCPPSAPRSSPAPPHPLVISPLPGFVQPLEPTICRGLILTGIFFPNSLLSLDTTTTALSSRQQIRNPVRAV